MATASRRLRKCPAGNPLPHRMYYKNGAYHRVHRNRWQRLAADYGQALTEWARLEGTTVTCTSIAEACARFLEDRGSELSPKTLAGYESSRRRIGEVFGHLQLDQLTRPDVSRYLKLRSAPVSANRDRAFLSSVYSYAIEQGWCTDNPARGVRRRAERPRDRVATPEEVAQLLAAARPVLRGLVDAALLTGLREGDLLALRRHQLTPAGVEVRTSKTGKVLRVAWSAELWNALCWALDAGADSVFPDPTGAPYSVDAFQRDWKALRRAAGVDGLQFRDLRRTAATHARDLAHASQLLGHHSPGITARVYRVADTVQPVR